MCIDGRSSTESGYSSSAPSRPNFDLPYVRIVVVNYDTGDVTLRALESAVRQDYPAHKFEVFLVDNGSIDGLVWKVRKRFPSIQIIESFTNEGFARGNNLAMASLHGVDVVALLNSDAIAHRNWLSELVAPLVTDPAVGVTTSKILFNRQVAGLEVEAFECDVRILATSLDGQDVTHELVHDERVASVSGSWLVLANQRGSISLPLLSNRTPVVGIKLASPRQCRAMIRNADRSIAVSIDSTPRWFYLKQLEPLFVINNAGGGIFSGFHGGDVGFKEVDFGQFDIARDVFSFCGAAAAIRVEFLSDVGLFDPNFFLYYEDLDLSWRGHYKGWRIRYVPQSVVTHEHAFSSGEWSSFFRFWVDRNRRLTLIKNAPLNVAGKAFFGAILWGLRDSSLPILRSLVSFRRPPMRAGIYRIRQLASFLKAVPSALVFRRRQLRSSKVRPRFVYEWISTRFKTAAGDSTKEVVNVKEA